jgi:predicted site-specific integrase-resolvase
MRVGTRIFFKLSCNITKTAKIRLCNDIPDARTGRLILTQKDRLLRFGAELVFAIREAQPEEVVIRNPG